MKHYWSFFLSQIANDAVYATAVWGGLQIIGHPFSWWALFLFMSAATFVFKNYSLSWKLHKASYKSSEKQHGEEPNE